MSVTFYLSTADTHDVPSVAVCGASDVVLGPAATWLAGRELYGDHCPDCQTYGPMLDNGRPDVNVSNVNARRLLDLLGYPATADMCGDDDPGEFLGRVLLAQALAGRDEGIPAHRTGPNTEDWGRRPGYTQDRLIALAQLAQDALAIGAVISWA